MSIYSLIANLARLEGQALADVIESARRVDQLDELLAALVQANNERGIALVQAALLRPQAAPAPMIGGSVTLSYSARFSPEDFERVERLMTRFQLNNPAQAIRYAVTLAALLLPPAVD